MSKQHTFYAQTMPGVEEIAWLEIRDKLPQAQFGEYLFAKDQNGIVVFQYDGDPKDVRQLRTTEDVFMQVLSVDKLSRGRRDLTHITEWVQQGEDLGRAVNDFLRFRKFSKPPTFRVISRKYGKHEYRRKDFERAVWKAMQKRYPRWTPVADGGEVEVWANLLGSQLLIGIRLTDRTMRHRFDKVVELPASLRPSVAAAMVHLSEPNKDDVFVDPMCGSGTILMERIAAGPYRRLYGGDIAPERVEATKKNLFQKVWLKSVLVRQWDVQQLPLNTYEADKVVTNLPFGKQIGQGQDLAKLYNAFFAELVRVLKPNGRCVLLTSEFDLLKEAVRQQPKLEVVRGYSIAVLGQWGRIYIVERKA
ncbi:MAG: RNA methyltransferase [Ardenticatenaceae bacterium]|nr:RNA methyltransferase [Ardenticatenaceae bacterium]